jgi:hypothetical protein
MPNNPEARANLMFHKAQPVRYPRQPHLLPPDRLCRSAAQSAGPVAVPFPAQALQLTHEQGYANDVMGQGS